MSESTIGIVGLGRMGGNMAQRLIDAGYTVVGTDVSEEAIDRFKERGGQPLETPAAVASTADLLITSLPSPEIVREVYLGADGISEGATPELIVLEMSTIDPDTILEVDEQRDDECHLLGAPISGGPESCREGSLTAMVGGEEHVFQRDEVQNLLEALTNRAYYAGDIEAGHTLKLINNVMSMGNLLLAVEAVSLGRARGVEGEVLYEVLSNAGGASNQFRKRMPRVLNREFEPGFTIDLTTKDIGLALDTADSVSYPMFITSDIYNLFLKAQNRGLGNEDMSAIVKLFEEDLNVNVEATEPVDSTFDGY